VDALLFNIDACKQVWQQLVETGDRKERNEAQGFLKVWNPKYIRFTAMLGDLL